MEFSVAAAVTQCERALRPKILLLEFFRQYLKNFFATIIANFV